MFSGQEHIRGSKAKAKLRLASLVLGVVLLLSQLPHFTLYLSAAGQNAETTSESVRLEDDPSDAAASQPYPNPPIELISPHAVAVDVSRGMLLYDKNSAEPQAIPLAGQLMTIILALENLQTDQSVTISQEAASRGGTASQNLGFEAGSQFQVDYLIRSLHYRDSAAARLALAEAVSQTEDSFLERMRAKAQELNLRDTTFTRLPGAGGGLLNQSTLRDAAALLRFALQLPFYQSIFHQKTYSHFDLENDRNYFFNNPLESSWSIWSNNTVNGSAYSAAGGQESAAYMAASNNTEIIFLLQAPSVSEEQTIFETSRFNQDVRTMTSSIFNYYDTTVLLRQYQPLPQSFEIDGVPVPLIALQTISYVHPQGNPSIQTTTLVRSGQSLTLPVTQYEVLGQVLYTLTNGTVLSADVGAMETVFATETAFDRLMAMAASYPTLIRMIAAVAGIVFIVGISKGTRYLLRRYYETQLERVEGTDSSRSKRTADRKAKRESGR